MKKTAQIPILILLILMVGSGCESLSWQTYEGEFPEWRRSIWQPNSFVPVYGVGVGASWNR